MTNQSKESGSERSMIKTTVDLLPVTAEFIIESKKRVKNRGTGLGEKGKAIFRLLCDHACTRKEIIAHLTKLGLLDSPPDKVRAILDSFFASRKDWIRSENGLWFVVDSKAHRSLKIKPEENYQNHIGRAWIRSFVFECLTGKDLTLGQLSDRLKQSGLQGCAIWPRQRLGKRIFNVLIRDPDIFEKKADHAGDIPAVDAKWGLKATAKIPVTVLETQTQALWNIMMSKNQISGWTLAELQKAVSDPKSNFKTDPSAKKNSVKVTLITRYLSKDPRFIKLGRSLYKARPPEILKPPADEKDWQQLVIKIVKDLGKTKHEIPDYNRVKKGILNFSHLYGYDVHKYYPKEMDTALNRQIAPIYAQLFGKENVPVISIAPSQRLKPQKELFKIDEDEEIYDADDIQPEVGSGYREMIFNEDE